MPSTTLPDLAELDLADPRLWDDGVPHDVFRALQRERPVHWSPQAVAPGEGGFWVDRALRGRARRDPRLRDVLQRAARDLPRRRHRRPARHPAPADDLDGPAPPLAAEEDRRQGVHPGARIAEHEEHIRAIVTHVLDGVAGRESFDLVADVARPLPARVIGSMLGTPPEDDPRLVHWTNVFTAFEDPEVRAQWTNTQEVLTEIVQYCGAQMEQRRQNPTGDLLTALMDAEVDGEKLDDFEVAVFFILLMAAGNDSTRATYSGIMTSLLERPALLQRLKDDPSLIPAAVEEGLRLHPAFAFMARAATRDVELHGQQIKEGDRVLLWYLASNRDETKFEDPDEFDLDRHNRDEHQAFGARGRHFCLGAALARLELRIWIEETLKRLPDLQLDGEPARVRALFLNQYSSIPVRRG